jgi:hypothetical protein
MIALDKPNYQGYLHVGIKTLPIDNPCGAKDNSAFEIPGHGSVQMATYTISRKKLERELSSLKITSHQLGLLKAGMSAWAIAGHH